MFGVGQQIKMTAAPATNFTEQPRFSAKAAFLRSNAGIDGAIIPAILPVKAISKPPCAGVHLDELRETSRQHQAQAQP